MIEFLNGIRKPEPMTTADKITHSFFILIVGIVLGVISKMLDETASNLLPPFIEALDLGNFFSRMGVWLFLAVIISIYSKSAVGAGLKVFLFFTGMVSSYYLYTIFIAGFFPRSYMMIWIVLTFISPLLAFTCWYSRGEKLISVVIAGLILMFITRQTFAFGFWYLDVINMLELLLWMATIFVLYQSPKQIWKVTIIGLVAYFLTSPLNLLWGMM